MSARRDWLVGVDIGAGSLKTMVVGRDGRVVARFAPDVTADDPRLRAAIDAALAA